MAANFQVIKMKKGKSTYEVLTHPGTIDGYRAGTSSVEDTLAVEAVYKNSSKGETLSLAELTGAFEGCETELEVAVAILDGGEVQLNAADRKAKMEAVHTGVVAYIHKHFIDPKTKTPHPIVRIENAIREAKVRLDMDTDPERQATDVVKKLRPILPLKKAELEAVVSLTHASMGAAMGILHSMAQVGASDYTGSGVDVSIGLLPGDIEPLVAALDAATRGDYTFTIAGMDDAAAAGGDDAGASSSGKKGKGKGKGKGKRKKK